MAPANGAVEPRGEIRRKPEFSDFPQRSDELNCYRDDHPEFSVLPSLLLPAKPPARVRVTCPVGRSGLFKASPLLRPRLPTVVTVFRSRLSHGIALWCSRLRFRVPLLLAVGLAGCASDSYRYGQFRPVSAPVPPLVVDRGEPHPHLDRLRDVVEFPRKLFRFGRPDSRPTTEQVEQTVVTYLEKNDLTDVAVEVGEYDPSRQWRRLRENERVGPLWKYSVGSLTVVGYSLLPARAFGIDTYNPFTDTLIVNSRNPPRALFEAARAKALRGEQFVGSSVVLSSLPFIRSVADVRQASDVLSYLRAEEQWDLETAAYPQLYAGVGKEAIGLVGWFIPISLGPGLGIGGRILGSATGQVVASQRRQEIEVILAERRRAQEALVELAGFEETDSSWADDAAGDVLPAVGEQNPADSDTVDPVESAEAAAEDE